MFKKIVKSMFVLTILLSTLFSPIFTYAVNDIHVDELNSREIYEDNELIFDEIDDYVDEQVPEVPEGDEKNYNDEQISGIADENEVLSEEIEINEVSLEINSLTSAVMPQGFVNASDIPLREGPGTSYVSIASLARNTTVTVLGSTSNGNWLRIRVGIGSGGAEGWIRPDRVTLQPPTNSTSFIRPMARGSITSPYGWRNGEFHRGVDISTGGGEPILAVADGTVHIRCNGWCGGYGNYIVLRHNINGTIYYTLYAHLRDSSNLNVGNTVTQGQRIGIEGNTGNSSGPHLHFEIHLGNFAYNANHTLDPTVRLNLPSSWSTR